MSNIYFLNHKIRVIGQKFITLALHLKCTLPSESEWSGYECRVIHLRLAVPAVTDGRYNSWWSRGGHYEVQLRLQGRTSQPTDVCSVQRLYICLCVQPNLISARINPIVVSLSSNIHLQGFPKIRASFWTYIELTAVFNVIA